jgi:hypothetical protein
MVSCPLFRLPQELRDKIYLYALYSGDGLLYQTCSHGISRLCRRAKRPRDIFHWFHRTRCHRRCTGCVRENNQLKYVCKRLRYETNRLDLLHDYVVFEDNAEEDALQQCMFLLYRCPTLEEVAIKCSLKTFQSNYKRHGFSMIVRHCQINAKIRARIYIPYWSQADPNFILIGLHFLATLRASTSPVAHFVLNNLGSHQPESSSALARIPGNIRIFPKEERFCRQIFEQRCRRNPSLNLPTDQAVLAEVMKRIESWFEYGI